MQFYAEVVLNSTLFGFEKNMCSRVQGLPAFGGAAKGG